MRVPLLFLAVLALVSALACPALCLGAEDDPRWDFSLGAADGQGVRDPALLPGFDEPESLAVPPGPEREFSGPGIWGIGFAFTGTGLVEDLSHALRFSYYKNNSDPAIVDGHNTGAWMGFSRGLAPGITGLNGQGPAMAFGEQVFEVNLDHTYQLYENLDAYLELGWMRMDMDDGARARESGRLDNGAEDAWKARVSFQFKF